MCVALQIGVKGITYRSPAFASVGCGVCEECRAVYKSGWAFRISAQFSPLVDAGWKMCFFTLTYDNRNLPTLPREVYKDSWHDYYTDVGALEVRHGVLLPSRDSLCNSRGIPCFSRDDIEGFTHHMRDWFRSCGVCDVQYFICSEFGDTTQRPHYHGIYVVPPLFDTRLLFERIKRYWAEGYYYCQGRKIKYHRAKGFLFPRYYQGGKDDNGYVHKPFVVESPNSAMRYIAKYVTKDLAFYEFLSSQGVTDAMFNRKSRVWRRCMPFHVQTRSLGKLFVDSLSTDAALDVLEHGASFLGDKKRRALPRYIKEKLLFIPYYRKKGNRRQVLRMPTPLFQEQSKKIFDIKCCFQDAVFKRHLSYDNFIKDCSPSLDDFNAYRCYHRIASDLSRKYGGLAAWKVAYYGQPLNKCYVPFTGELHEYFLERYKPFSSFQPYRLNCSEFSDFDTISFCLSAMDFYSSRNPRRRSFEQREIDKTRDWWKHREYIDLVG